MRSELRNLTGALAFGALETTRRPPWLRVAFGLTLLALLGSVPAAAHATTFTFTYTTLDAPGATSTWAFGINDAGRVAGHSSPGLGTTGFVYDSSTASYTTHDFPLSPGATQFWDINNQGRIAGWQSSTNEPYIFDGASSWDTLSGRPGAFGNIRPKRINDAGVLIGSIVRADHSEGGFVFDGTNIAAGWSTLDFPSALDTVIEGINGAGEIVGSYDNANGFLYDGSAFSALDSPDPFVTHTFPRAINDVGIVVGDVIRTNHRGFLYDGTDWSTIRVPGSRDTFATDVNNQGVVTGWYWDYSFNTHAFIAVPDSVPVPEPASGLLLASGLVGLAAFRRGRRRRRTRG